MGWTMGLEPTTTGITIRGSTNWATPTTTYYFLKMVRTERLELSHREAPEPKSGVSTNSTTAALHYY